MEVVTGIFHFPADATRTGERLRETGIPHEKITLVTPGASRAEFGADWWMGLREVEKTHYEGTTGKSFGEAEPAYRRGYEVALHRYYRGRSYDEVAQELQKRHGDESRADDFRRGYERAHASYASRSWMVTTPAPAPLPTGVRPRSWWR